MFNSKKITYLENRVQALERNQETMFNEISTLRDKVTKLDKRVFTLESQLNPVDVDERGKPFVKENSFESILQRLDTLEMYNHSHHNSSKVKK